MLLVKEFTFDAAHNLVKYHGKCERLHGHTYRMAVTVSGRPGEEGMVMDFAELGDMVKREVVSKFDHSYLNDIIPQPTAENIARYVFKSLDGHFCGLDCELRSVQVWETKNSSAIFGREDLRAEATADGIGGEGA
ncbi:MAG: 6-carboxytetrahydropterin synthase QueD [Synergistaceae bacterium]|jgi:6-pyruvoyltetrahydropterin/6-carboxytetrahydropterin synthase|nr:6-carboxytetrahydropterin synthase QueD [Synergistaceae bacterium]